MRTCFVFGLALVLAAGGAGPATARDPERAAARWWRGACHEQLLGGPCEVKLESKPGEYKREIKCKDGVGATWERGEWKEEYQDGPCKVKIEAKPDELKEEILCR